MHIHVSIGAYKRALKEQESADVAYARLMLLGSAGTGKTSLKHSLMEEPFNPHTTSTIVSDVSSVRPFGHKWQTMRENKWREATEEDEIKEIASLFKFIQSRSSSYHTSVLSAKYSCDESDALVSTGSIASDFNVEIRIKSIFERASSTDQKTELLVQPFLHIWDCGGQPVFLEILPAFLTPRTMFLLLFDASKDFRERWQSRQNTPDGKVLFVEVVNESTSDLMVKWISTIHSYLVKHNKEDASSPSLYCIGTRGDKLKRKRKREQVKKQIQSLYEEKEFSDLIEDVLIIDNTTSGRGEKEDPSITELREAVDSFINNLAVKTPVNWVLFRKVLRELKQNIISVSDAIAIGVACHIRADDVPEVLKFYHELGAVLYYPQLEGLNKKVILNPKWFVDTIGKVFPLEKGWRGTNRWYLLQNKGILVQPLYQEVWQSSSIDPEEIIELLVHFRLAAQVQTDLYDGRFKQYFLPAVLPGYTGDPNE
uniref:COR domain-containing protein n=1 Tax=Amphimedon queenslandica TaxID=400682 RepID=A0A1X7ST06_AMPQE